MNFLAVSVFVCVFFVNVRGFYLKSDNEAQVIEFTNPVTPKSAQHFFEIIEKILRDFNKKLEFKIGEQVTQSEQNSTLHKFLQSLNTSMGSRKVRSVLNSPDSRARSNNDWPEFASKAEFEDFKIMETQHLNSLKEEINKLDRLLHLLQDQHKVLTVLDGFGSKPDEIGKEKDYLELLKMAQSIPCYKQKYSGDNQDKELLTNVMQEIGQLKNLMQVQNFQEKTNERQLLQSIEGQKMQLQRLETIVERFPEYLKVSKPAEEGSRSDTELRQNGKPLRSVSQQLEPQIQNPPRRQPELEIVGAPQHLRSNIVTKNWNPKSRSSSDYDYSQLLSLLNERKPKTNEALRGSAAKSIPVKSTPKLRAEEDDFMENLEKLMDRQPKAKESLNSHSDIEKRLLELQRQLEISEQFNNIESKIAQLSTGESKTLDSSNDELKEEVRKLNSQLKKLNKGPVESKSLEDEALKRELKNLQLKNELKNLQAAIDGMRPQDGFDFRGQSKIGSLEFQAMLNQLIDSEEVDGTGFRPSGSTGHLSEAEIHLIKQQMAAASGGLGGKRPRWQPSNGYGVGNFPYGNGGSRYDAQFGLSNGDDGLYGVRGAPYSNFYGPYSNYLGMNDFYGNQNNLLNPGLYPRPYSSYRPKTLSKHQYVSQNPSTWSQYSQLPTTNHQYKPINLPLNSKPHDYFGSGQYGTNRNQLNDANDPNYFSSPANAASQPSYVDSAQTTYNGATPTTSYPLNPKPELSIPAPPSNPPSNIFYGAPSNDQLNRYRPPTSSFDVHNIFEQLAAGGGPEGSNFRPFQEPANYKSSVNLDAPNSAQPYGNPPENPPIGDGYSQQQVGDLKNQIYNLQNVINNLNQPDYAQSPGDRETVYKLDKRITDLKNVINQIGADPNAAQYGNVNPPPVEQQQNYPPPENPVNQGSDKPGDPNYTPPSRRRRTAQLTDFGKLRDTIRTIVLGLANNQSLNFKDAQRSKRQVSKSEEEKIAAMREFFLQLQEMASAVNYLYDGLLASQNSSSQELARIARQNTVADSVDVTDKLKRVIEMIDNLEKNVQMQSKRCPCAARKKREDATSETMDKLKSFLKQIVDEELKSEQETKEDRVYGPIYLNDKLRDLVNRDTPQRHYNFPKIENFRTGSKATHGDNRKLLHDKLRELEEQLAQRVSIHRMDYRSKPQQPFPSWHSQTFGHNSYRTPANLATQTVANEDRFDRHFHPPNDFPMENQRIISDYFDGFAPNSVQNQNKFDTSSNENQTLHFYASPKFSEQRSKFNKDYPYYDGYYDKHIQKEIKTDSLLEKIIAKVMKKIFESVAEQLPTLLQKLLGFGFGSFLNFNDYGYDNDRSVEYDSSGYQIVKPKSFLGLVPMIILKLITSLTSFLKQLQKNKFMRNFLVPALVAGLSGGLVLFLVWWFTSSEQYGDNYDKNMYVANENYYKANSDYTNDYRSSLNDNSRQSYANPYLYLNRSSYPNYNSFNYKYR